MQTIHGVGSSTRSISLARTLLLWFVTSSVRSALRSSTPPVDRPLNETGTKFVLPLIDSLHACQHTAYWLTRLHRPQSPIPLMFSKIEDAVLCLFPPSFRWTCFALALPSAYARRFPNIPTVYCLSINTIRSGSTGSANTPRTNYYYIKNITIFGVISGYLWHFTRGRWATNRASLSQLAPVGCDQ